MHNRPHLPDADRAPPPAGTGPRPAARFPQTLAGVGADLARASRARLRGFARAEDGALIALSLYIFIAMLLLSGVAIEFMRQEERRTIVQNTADRATLAAADLSQSMNPTDVVVDYFDKAGLGGLNVVPTVATGSWGASKTVSVDIAATYPTFLASLVGLDEMTVAAQSTATESIGLVEISLVLDVSGSMGDPVYSGRRYLGRRIDLLKSAANDFVDTMFENVQPAGAPAGRLAISVVPYNQQVTLGTTTARYFNLSNDHSQNTCVDFYDFDFGSASVSPAAALQRTMWGDSFDYAQWGFSTPNYWQIQNCVEVSRNSVLAFSNSQTDIKNKINSLDADGDTAIDIGAKWGFALLDPAARPALNAMISAGDASASLSGRPYSYNERDAMKVMVLMTDGQNTRSYSLKPAYRSGTSPVVSTRGANDTREDSLYYYNSYYNYYYRFYDNRWIAAWSMPRTYPVSYEAMYARWPVQYVVNKYLSKAWNMNSTTLYNQMTLQSEYDDKDTRLHNLCEAAKDASAAGDANNLLIFTIAVDAPTDGKVVLEDCATAKATAFDVTSVEMSEAFAGIAASINALRLTN
ncbi:TadE/TadG family type IV pilus assembly protein [Phaeovulum vinaykumarii]|uniref:Flp pilus assembly protein TadG n=1 Tax=Phaeovulum vinaykumarii TaxID=407234 RepID=A0A1N7LGQ6_9RHOB|nr:pilus assembly protein TadG-related protein [Phaeovulum vinaykumarii]SIS72997.1 Flp pilus assembly protein TadG [Phaeovulum vinaykumarii]SOC04594.1 Flp pilus assembly protein TadG [Phaeovulum vinaykumarii]